MKRRPVVGGDVFAIGGGRVVVESGGGETLLLSEVDSPQGGALLSHLLDIALEHSVALQGGCVLHACAFQALGIGILALGGSGAGKSTLAALALRCGGRVLSDDVVVAADLPGELPRLVPWRRDLSLREPSNGLLPPHVRAAPRRFSPGDSPRWVVERARNRRCFLGTLSPVTLWDVSVDRRLGRTRIEPLDKSRSLAALMRGTGALYLSHRYPKERDGVLGVLKRLVESSTGWKVRMGLDLLRAPDDSFTRLVEATSR